MNNLTSIRDRRGMTLAEAMIAIAIGGVLSIIAYSLIAQVHNATRRLDFRVMLVADSGEAVNAIERELDYMVPLGWPTLDFSHERWETERVRFFSSRDLRGSNQLWLVELRLESADPGPRGRARAVGTADAATVTDRLVIEYFTADGNPTGRIETLHRFRAEGAASVEFESSLDAPGAAAEDGASVVLRLVRPPSLTMRMSLAPASAALAEQVAATTEEYTWSLTRKGGGA